MVDILIFSDINNIFGFSRYAGPYRVATELRQHGYSVQVVEFFGDLELKEIKEILAKYVSRQTLWVGFAATLWTVAQSQEEMLSRFQKPQSLRSIIADKHAGLFPHSDQFMAEVLNEIRTLNKECRIVVGGHQARHLSFKGVDYWILGQAESSVVKLSDHLRYGRKLECVKTEHGNVLSDKMFPYDRFPSSRIQWHDVDHIRRGESLPIEIARGCIFRCAFCAFDLNGKKRGDFVKDTSILKDEFVRNYEKYGTTSYMLTDDTLNDSPGKIESLHKLFTNLPFKLEFSAYCRIDVLHKYPFMINALKEMGLRSVEFGIESLNPPTCRLIGKSLEPELVKDTLTNAKEIWRDQVYIAAGFIVGLPAETEESIRKTITWLESPSCPLDGIQFNRLWINSPKAFEHRESDLTAAGFTRRPEGWVYGGLSGIAQSPEKYGYSLRSGGDWKNSDISLEAALALEKEFYSSGRSKAKFSLSIFQYYNRMRNLDYTHEQIGSLYFNDPEFGHKAVAQKESIKVEYLERLLI